MNDAIRKDGDRPGFWMIDTTVTMPDKTRKHFKKRGFVSRQSAFDSYDQCVQQFVENHGFVGPDDVFDSLFSAYMSNYSSTVEISTANNEKLASRKWILSFFSGRKTSSVFTISSFQAWRDWLKATCSSPGKANKMISRMRLIGSFAESIGQINEKQMRMVDVMTKRFPSCSAPVPEIRIWTPSQKNDFMSSFHDEREWLVFFEWAFYTGCRIGELVGMEWGDIDFGKMEWSVRRSVCHSCGTGRSEELPPKTDAGFRTLPMSDSMAKEMLWLKNGFQGARDSDYVFFSGRSPIGRSTIIRHFHDHIKESGVPIIRFHGIRHYRDTELVSSCESTVDVKAVDYWMGRSTTSVTVGTYFHTTKDAIERISKII